MSSDLPLLDVLELRSLDVPQGGAWRTEARVAVEPLTLGGQTYVCVPPDPVLRLDASRGVGAAWYFRLRGRCAVEGPCWRCLAPARVALTLDVSEISDPESDDREMRSLYVRGGRLLVAAWARDAVAEAMPPTILCREDCAGLCPVCGADLNAEPAHSHDEPADTRWGPLADLRARLEDAGDGG
jgi:uncharacterized protein